MFEGLNWRSAARRSATVIAIYLVLFYVLSRVAPRSFPLDASLLVMAFFFFFVFTFIYAFVERSRNRRIEEVRRKKAAEKKPAREEGDEGPTALRGRPNPNTSRKKSRRRR